MAHYLSHHDVVGGSQATSAPTPQPTAPPFKLADPALVLLEFASIALGISAADTMVKRAAVQVLHTGTVQPGRYLVLVGGEVAEVEEALNAARAAYPTAIEDSVWLPGVHPAVLTVIHAAHQAPPVMRSLTASALGIIETRTAPAAIHSADVAIKGAMIDLLSIRLADGLGGKGLVLVAGAVADVEAALGLVKAAVAGMLLINVVCIAQLHEDMARQLLGNTRFFRE